MNRLILMFCLFPILAFSQANSDTTKKYTITGWSLGTPLMPIFRGFDNSYFVMGKFYTKDGNAFRLGATAGFHNSLNEIFNNNDFSFELALGFENTKFLDQRWRTFYGVDFDIAGNYHGTKSFYTQSYSLGIAPFIGAEYRINKYLSVSSEFGVGIFIGKNNLGSSNPYTAVDFRGVASRLLMVQYYFQ